MKTILHVSCSPRGEASGSLRLSRAILGFLLRAHPGAVVVERVVGGVEIPAIDADYATSQQSSADVSQAGSMATLRSAGPGTGAGRYRGHRHADA